MHAMLIYWILVTVGAFLAEPVLFAKVVFGIIVVVAIRILW